jgi:hypothetical protein
MRLSSSPMNAWEMRIPRLSGIENSNLLLPFTWEVFWRDSVWEIG